MTPLRGLLLSLCAALACTLAGCPTPPPDEAGPGAGSADPAGAEVAPPMPTDPGVSTPSAGDPGAAPGFNPAADKDLVFDRFMKEGEPTIDITVTVAGAKKSRIEFTALVEDDAGEARPQAIHVQEFAGSTVTIKAPATFEHPLYVMVQEALEGAAPGPILRGGALTKPVELAGENLNLSITMTDKPTMPFGPPPTGNPPTAPGAPAPAPAEAPAAPAEAPAVPGPAAATPG